MSFVARRALPRRTFLRGAGAALSLPLLDAMVPSLTALDRTPADPAKLRRLGFVYMPMGCAPTRGVRAQPPPPPAATRWASCPPRWPRWRR